MDGEGGALVTTTLELALSRLSADLPELSHRVADVVHQELPSYRVFDEEDARRAVERNLEAAVQALRSRAPRPDDDFAGIDKTIRERFEAGITVDDAVRAFAMCIWRIHQRFMEVSRDLLIGGEDAIEGSDLLWQLGDAITVRVVSTYNELDAQRSLMDLQRRAGLVRRLLTGRAAPNELDPSVFDADGEYAAVRCITHDGVGLKDMAALERTGSASRRAAVLGLVGGECVGIVARRPEPPTGMLVAVGPTVPLSEIKRSFTIADKACHVAHHLRRRGIQTMDSLTWRLAAVDEPEVTELLRARYIEPLRAEGEFGRDIEKSVRRYLAKELNVPETARALSVHANTLRYRLRKFTELTGADLDTPATLMEVTWAFQLGTMPRWTCRF